VAGPCLAYWLLDHGFQPTLVERAPRLRSGGYVIDFWGAGFDVAERMGLLPQLVDKGYRMKELRLVDRRGRRVGGFDARVFERLTHGRFTSLPRSELARALYQSVEDEVETLFDNTVTAITERGSGVDVEFEDGPARRFDLVVGADGLHSQVRRLVFGEADRFERYLGLKVAAFSAQGYRPRDELTYVIHSEIGQQVGRLSMRDDRTMFLFVFKDPNPEIPVDLPDQKALLRERFADSGWECSNILRALDDVDTLYIDRVSQVRMERWARGRVALVGDAAFCVSLLAGQGSALAMVAAYVLAAELVRARHDPELAFARYQDSLGSYISNKQRAALKLVPFFAPHSRFGMFARNQLMKLMALPFVAELTAGRSLRDRIELPSF